MANQCYYRLMGKYFENKINYNQITFSLTNKPDIYEREIHSYHEVLLYVSGDGQLLTKDGQRTLSNRSVFIFPSDTYHFFRIKKSENFLRLKISFPIDTFKDVVLSEFKMFENLNKNLGYLFDTIYNALNMKSDKSGFYAYSAFLMLLSELDKLKDEENNVGYTENSKLTRELADYISENLSDELNINLLSKKFLVSSSKIVHLFKKEFGISIHKYIVEKRLVRAKQLISQGKQPSRIYSDVGFGDYSSFYKAYVNFFGYPPSNKRRIIK